MMCLITRADFLTDPEICRHYATATLQYDVASLLQRTRTAHGLTQAALATQSGLSRTFLEKLEQGEANPRLTHLGTVFAMLGYQLTLTLQPLPTKAPSTLPPL